MIRTVFLLAMLAACQTEADGDPCGAAGYGSLIGKPLASVSLPVDLRQRVIGPDTMVTQDHVPERLNIEVDASGTILALNCG